MITIRFQKKILLIACSFLLGTFTSGATGAENWQCELDLHQGDTGVLKFTKNGRNIEGKTVVSRNTGAGPFEHTISGTWRGEVIDFKRTLNPPTSQQRFKGIALRTADATNRPTDVRPDDPTIRMAGRFAFKYSGIWSADCRLQLKPHRTGRLEIKQTFQADLDTGTVISGAKADIWFQAKTARKRYITPRNGALIKIAGRQSVGREGCAALRLAGNAIPLDSIPVGTYVCVKTTEGRYSQFRINEQAGPSPGKLKIGFTTWQR